MTDENPALVGRTLLRRLDIGAARPRRLTGKYF